MNKYLKLLSGMALAGLASSAMAADLPARQVYREAQVVAPVANWTGWYVGAGGGYGLYDADSNATSRTGAGAVTTANNGTTGGKGYLGRVQVGFDYQFGNNFVTGVFADYDISSIKGTLNDLLSPGNINFKQTSAWGAGGRVGYLVNPQFLTFFDGGYTQARFTGGAETFNLACTGCLVGATGLALPNQNFSGYFLGGGTEYMMFPGWFVKSEYRLASYSAKTTAMVLGPPATTLGGLTSASITNKPTV